MHPVLCLRPEPGLSATMARGTALGLEMIGLPLSRIAPVTWDVPASESFDAILAGSANIFRHGGAGLVGLHSLPVMAVGQTTAAAARDAGFKVNQIGHGGLQLLIDRLADQPMRFLRLCGEDRVPLQLHPGHQLVERIVYHSVPLHIPDSASPVFARKPVVLLHSAASAQLFVSECKRLVLDRATIVLAALGPRIIADIGDGWGQVLLPDTPDDTALLAKVAKMCK